MKKIILAIAILTIIHVGCEKKVENVNPFKQGYKNIVTEHTIFHSEQSVFSETESLEEAFDIDKNTKFLVAHPKNTITIENKVVSVLKKYKITSAIDAPGRDPKIWTLSGSSNGSSWEVLDTQNDQVFKKRGTTNNYSIESNIKAYSFYKLDMEHSHTSVFGDDYLQIAEVELIALTNEPTTEFTTNLSRTKIEDTIHFKDVSANAPDTWHWIFENGIPSTSNIQNPKVTYSRPGNYNVTLISKNEFGVDTLLIKRKIKVYDPKNPWEGFYFPEIILSHKDTVSEGYKRATSVIPNIKKAINEVSLGVCKQLYRNMSEVPDFEEVHFAFNWSDILAAKEGNGTIMKLWFSTKYIQNNLKDEPDEAVKHEIYGVLWHELTHGYQFTPTTADNQYKLGYDYFAFLEGEADLVRINAGYHKTRHPSLGKHKYLSGYTSSGFFLKWIVDTYDDDFIYKFNASSKTINPWSYKAAIKQIIDKDVDELWEEYILYIKNYNKTNKPVKRKKIDWMNM
tara:strand:- start:746 stop:2275 length:1530 start_codon:yes stop_codon:yes gene_type:complete